MFACYSSGQLSEPYSRKSKAGSSKGVAIHCVGEPFVTGHRGCQSYAEEHLRGKFAYVNVTVCVFFHQAKFKQCFSLLYEQNKTYLFSKKSCF